MSKTIARNISQPHLWTDNIRAGFSYTKKIHNCALYAYTFVEVISFIGCGWQGCGGGGGGGGWWWWLVGGGHVVGVVVLMVVRRGVCG